jgi:excisionase family DNA binding protein
MQFTNISTYSIKRAAQLLKVSPSYISHLIAEGELDFFLPPGKKHKRIPHNVIAEFIEKHTFNNKKEGDK